MSLRHSLFARLLAGRYPADWRAHYAERRVEGMGLSLCGDI